MKARFLALAALVLGLASCQQEFNDVAQLGGEVDYQLKVDAAELATRAGVGGVDDQNNHYDSAFGAIDYLQAGNGVDEYRVDWTEVDLRYSLEVYDWNEEGNYTGAVPVKDRMVKIVDAYEPVVFDLRLVPGRNYHFVVFADFVPNGASNDPNVTYQRNLGKRHIIGDNLGDIRIKENEDAINDEIGDAYFATKKVEVKHQALNVDGIVLQRPYGKLRVIATDLAELNLNVEPKSVFVKYTANRPVHFNAVTGAVETDATVKEYTSEYNDGVCKLIANNTIGLANHFYNAGYDSGSDAYSTVNADGVKRHTHMTLFTDYILAIDEQTTVQFEMTVSDANKEIKKTIFNTEIPVQRNHLTTIVGNVLTSATEITVTIDDNFANADNPTDTPFYQVVVTDGYELVKAAMAGYKVILDGGVDKDGNKLPITLTAKDFEKYYAELTTRAGQTTYTFPNGTEIDLNGYTLIIENNSDQPLIVVNNDNTLNIVDNSDENKGEVILRGEGDGAAIQNNGTLNIEGVELESKTEGSVIDNNGETNIVDSTLNNGALTNNEEAEANIAGGTLNAGSVKNDGMTNVNGSDVDGNAITNGENATVGSYIKNADGLQAAINAAVAGTANKFTLNSDIEGEITIIQKPNVKITIDGTDKKFKIIGQIKVHSNSNHYADAALTIKNVNFETSTASLNFIEALENGSQRYSTNITVKDCTFTATGAAADTAVGLQIKASKWAKAINCTATGLHSLVQAQSCDTTVDVIGCNINGKNGVAFKQVKAAKVEGTTIEAREYGIRFDGNIDNYGIVAKDNNITAAQPFIVRKMTGKNNTITLVGENTLTSNREAYNIVITNGSDDAEYVKPTGTYTLTGADGFIVYPDTVVVADGLLKKENTYLVTNANGLVALSGMTIKGYEIVTLGADIDLTGVEFNGLNAFNPETPNTFDGQGHTVSNWTNNSGASDMGFIRNWVGPIKNVKFEKCHLKTSGRSAIAAGKVYGNIEKVTINDCTIEDSYWACGLVAGHYNAGNISNCTVTNSYIKSNGGTGGIVGVINESAGTRKVENCKVENCTINNTGAYGEGYSGALICGMINISNSTVEFNNCSYKNNTKQGNYVGDMYYNADADITVKIDGAVYACTELKDILATTYEGEVFESGYMENALWLNNYVFSGDAAIVIENKKYNAIIVENCSGEFQNDVITIKNDNSSVMILQNLNLTLAEGKKLIKAANKTYQVFMANIIINGEKMTTESMAKYLENVEWYQVVEEI